MRSCVLCDVRALFFVKPKEEGAMNLNAEMIPGLCLLIAGAVIGFGAKPICRREQNIPQVKLLGVGLAAIGAILIFLP